MAKIDTLTDYNSGAHEFDRFRKPSSINVEMLKEAFANVGGAILSIGCGTGKYENALSNSNKIVGMDKSRGMLDLASKRIRCCVSGDMLHLPFKDSVFSGTYFMQSLHHVGANFNIDAEERESARKQALKEAVRVLAEGPLLIFQRDPSQNQAVWFWKYFPKALEKKLIIQPKIALIKEWLEELGLTNVHAEPINDPMIEEFYNPEAPLSEGFQHAFSEFSYLSKNELNAGLTKLKAAIDNGTVVRDIEDCKERFTEIGGTIFMLYAMKI